MSGWWHRLHRARNRVASPGKTATAASEGANGAEQNILKRSLIYFSKIEFLSLDVGCTWKKESKRRLFVPITDLIGWGQLRPRKSERKWLECKPASSLYRSWSLALQGLPTSSDTHTTSYKSVPLATPLTFGLLGKVASKWKMFLTFTFASACSSFLVLKPTSTHAQCMHTLSQFAFSSVHFLFSSSFFGSLWAAGQICSIKSSSICGAYICPISAPIVSAPPPTQVATLCCLSRLALLLPERGGCYYRYCYLLKHPLPQTFTSIYILPA